MLEPNCNIKTHVSCLNPIETPQYADMMQIAKRFRVKMQQLKAKGLI